MSLKGACKYSGPNWNYYLTQDKSQNLGYYFEGYKRDIIAQLEDKQWHIIDAKGPSVYKLDPFTEGRFIGDMWHGTAIGKCKTLSDYDYWSHMRSTCYIYCY